MGVFILGVGGIIPLTVLEGQSQSFDSSGYGPSNFGAGLQAAQNHYEFAQMVETMYAPLMTLSLVATSHARSQAHIHSQSIASFMAYVDVTLEHPETGQVKTAPYGFSWKTALLGFFPTLLLVLAWS